jgi:hypothetical protein
MNKSSATLYIEPKEKENSNSELYELHYVFVKEAQKLFS